MARPLPGMDPWLEDPGVWPHVHNAVIAALGAQLGPRLRPHYVVRLEERTYLDDPDGLVFVGRPDLTVAGGEEQVREPEPAHNRTSLVVEVPVPDRIRETWLEIRTPQGDVVTVLELLSPSNKRPGRGRTLYLEKRQRVLESQTNLVEIDLLRAGERMPVLGVPEHEQYRVLISTGRSRPRATLLTFTVRDSIPDFRLPLRPGDDEPLVELQACIEKIYHEGGFDLTLDYATPPNPPLADDDAAFALQRLRETGTLS